MKKESIFKKLILLILCVSLLLPGVSGVVLAQGETFSEEELVTMVNPILQHYNLGEENGIWKMTDDTRLVILANESNMKNERLAEVVKLVNSELFDKEIVGSPLAMVYGDKGNAYDILINVDRENPISDETDSDEAYKIEISKDGVVLTGASENAVLYGLRTIENMMISNNMGLVYGEIVDYPDIAERRIHVDAARKYISKDWFIRQIREMSYMKMNALQLHFSENLGFRIESETDPAIVSKDGYLTKDEVREIIAEGNKYGVKIIPSFDSPGHVDQILRAHPEYGQVNNRGEHYKSGLDITNPEAVQYIRSLYEEYMELFEGCTDIHIGGDEYMEFDRPPFTTEYMSVLNNFAKEKYGEGHTWKDAISGYINELAEFVHDHGFTPRIWNDGIYYGENSYLGSQKIKMHDYIGIDFWSQMSWNPSIANLQTFIDKGHDTIYNINASFFYYVLRNDKPSDGREQHSFDNLNSDKKIFEEWTPGKFQENTVPDDSPFIKGASLAIWCDNPNLVDEDVITEDISNEMRALASKSWNVNSNKNISFEEFKENYTKLGNVAGFEKGSTLPDSGEIFGEENLGKVVLKYQTEDGESIEKDSIKYGTIGEDYEFNAKDIYGYKLVSEEVVKGKYEKEPTTHIFTYKLFTDKSKLEEEVKNALDPSQYIDETVEEYVEALEEAKKLLEDDKAFQLDVDEVLNKLTNAKEKIVNLNNYPLYIEAKYPLVNDGYAFGYDEYMEQVKEGQKLLEDKNLSLEDMKKAYDNIIEKKDNLMKSYGNVPEIKATDGYYVDWFGQADAYDFSKMLDNDPSTKTWFNANQAAGKTITFIFPNVISMSQIKIDQPEDVGADIIAGADVEISLDGEEWTKVGDINNVISKTIDFDPTNVKFVRIKLTENKDNWYQIQDVFFTFEQLEEDNTLRDLIQKGENVDYLDKDKDLVNDLVNALIEGQKALVNKEQDTKEIVNKIQAAIDKLDSTTGEPTEVDKSQLEELFYEAIMYEGELDKYTEESANNFKEALENALRVYIDTEASQDQVNEAAKDLRDKIDNLEEKDVEEPDKVDKSALEELFVELKAIEDDLDKYTEESVKELEEVAERAIETYQDPSAGQEQVDKVAKELREKIDNLEEKDVEEPDKVDKSALEDLFKEISTLEKDLDKYTEESVNDLMTTLEKAVVIYEDKEASQDQVNEIAKELRDKIDNLEEKIIEKPVDKSQLEEVINRGKELKPKDYTDDSYKNLLEAIEEGEKLLRDEEISQIEVDIAKVKIEMAITNLVKIEEPDLPHGKNGWLMEDGSWYYYKDGKRVVDKWIWAEIDLDQDGEVDSHNWKYFNKEGKSQTTFYIDGDEVWLSMEGPYSEYYRGWWENESGMKYYFRRTSGSRVKGKQWIEGSYRYFRESGTLLVGWQYVDGGWRYFREDGSMVVDKWVWLPVDINNDGKIDKYNWKYFNKEGLSQTTFYIDKGNVWLSQSGPYREYLKGWWTNEAGMTYYFRETSGSRVSGWQYIEGSWRYFRTSGTMVRGRQFIENRWYEFDSDGSLIGKR